MITLVWLSDLLDLNLFVEALALWRVGAQIVSMLVATAG